MRLKNKIVLTSLLLLVFATACTNDFLNEENNRTFDTDRFKTQEGLDELATGLYSKLRFQFSYDWAVTFYQLGTDETTDANNEVPTFNAYTQELKALTSWNQTQHWDNQYAPIETANTLLQNIPMYYNEANANYNARLGEAHFFRAYFYFELVQQYGGVPLKLTPSTVVETYFARNTAEECYSQIISDFKQAYELLPESSNEFGRVLKTTAAHFLAKAHLTRASEINNDWNDAYKDVDLDAVIAYADEVIAAHPLAVNYSDLWNYTKANDDNELNSEIVLSAQFSNDWTTIDRYGNQTHLYFPSVYMDLAGCKRDISGGREFCYTRTTNYMIDVFDRVNDSRFWKSFITMYGANQTSGAPVYTASNAPSPSLVGEKRFVGGELGIKYIINDAGDGRYKQYVDAEGVKDPTGVLKNGEFQNTHTFIRYFEGESADWLGVHGNYGYYDPIAKKRYPSTSKYRDGYRQNLSSQFGTKDGIIARAAEDYLFAAEAYIRKGDVAGAIPYFNALRERAAYKEGENRALHIDGGASYENNPYITDGGGGFSAEGAIYWPENTYYESNNDMVETTESSIANLILSSAADIESSKEDQIINQAIKATGGKEDIYMTFLLNERTRELSCEQLRWKDLARTMTLGPRIRAFNDGQIRSKTPFSDETICLRPIPQHFLDGITDENGQTLSPEAKQKMQNPGY